MLPTKLSEFDLKTAFVRYYVQRANDLIGEHQDEVMKWRTRESTGLFLTVITLLGSYRVIEPLWIALGITTIVGIVSIGIPTYKINRKTKKSKERNPVFKGEVEGERVIQRMSDLKPKEKLILRDIIKVLIDKKDRHNSEFKKLIKKSYENYPDLKGIHLIKSAYSELNCGDL